MPANFCFNHKEQVVIKEMVKGLNNKQIAKKTQMGESTVKWYVAKINQKNTKNYLLNYALTGLGEAGMAASSWYKNNEGGIFPQ